MKILVTHSYTHEFEMEVPDNATATEIIKLANEEDEYLGGNWHTSWEEIESEPIRLLDWLQEHGLDFIDFRNRYNAEHPEHTIPNYVTCEYCGEDEHLENAYLKDEKHLMCRLCAMDDFDNLEI